MKFPGPLFFLICTLLSANVVASDNVRNEKQSQLVEVVGFADLREEDTRNDVHRRAVKNTLKNALLQAHVAVEVRANTRNMRMEEEVVSVQANGYIETSEILEADFIELGSEIYKVKMRVLVSPAEEKK